MNWQKDISNKINNKKINKIILPGTHDSGAYKFTNIKVSKNIHKNQQVFEYLRKYSIIPLVKTIINRWTLTQQNSIYKQAINGIRFFDLRIFWSDTQNDFYLGHSLPLITYDKFIDDIISFLNKSKNEFIVLKIKRDWNNRHTMNDKRELLWSKTKQKKEFYNKIWNQHSIPTYRELMRSDKRIIIITENILQNENLYTINNNFRSHWANTNDKELTIQSQQTWLNKNTFADNFFVETSPVFTPKTSDIVKDTEAYIYKILGSLFLSITIFLGIFISNRFQTIKFIFLLINGFLSLLCLILFFVRDCHKRLDGIKKESIPLQKEFLKRLKKNHNLINKLSIISFDYPEKESIDYVINLNNNS